MSYPASKVLDSARVKLNDLTGSTFKDSILLPILNDIYQDFQETLIDNKVPVTESVLYPARLIPLSTDQNKPVLFPFPPSNLYQPQWIGERLPGSLDVYVPLTERPWDVNERITDSLRYYVWREEKIWFPGATTDREVLLRYLKFLGEITSAKDDIPISNSRAYLSFKLGADAAKLINRDYDLSANLNAEAEKALTKLTGISAKEKQGSPVRRRPFFAFRRYR